MGSESPAIETKRGQQLFHGCYRNNGYLMPEQLRFRRLTTTRRPKWVWDLNELLSLSNQRLEHVGLPSGRPRSLAVIFVSCDVRLTSIELPLEAPHTYNQSKRN